MGNPMQYVGRRDGELMEHSSNAWIPIHHSSTTLKSPIYPFAVFLFIILKSKRKQKDIYFPHSTFLLNHCIHTLVEQGRSLKLGSSNGGFLFRSQALVSRDL